MIKPVLDASGNRLTVVGGAALTFDYTPPLTQVTINEGQTAVGWFLPGSTIVGGIDATSFEILPSGFLMTAGAPLADGMYNVTLLEAGVTIYLELTILPSGGAEIRSKAAFNVADDLALAVTHNITPASYANWTAFLAAQAPLTGKVFGFAAGDYTSWGWLALTNAHGDGTSAQRVVFKYNGANASSDPWDRAEQATFTLITTTNVSHYLFHGIKLYDSSLPGAYVILIDQGSENIIADAIWTADPSAHGIRLRDCTNCGVQFSRLERINNKNSSDRIALNTRNNLTHVLGPRFVGNEVINFSDACQFTRAAANPATLFTRNGIVYDNIFRVTDEYYASLAPTDLIENAIDMKIGGETADEMMIVRGNTLTNWRPIGPTGGAGEAFVFQEYAQFLRFEDNAISDCELGYRNETWPAPPSGAGARFDYIRRNIFDGITKTSERNDAGSCIAGYTPTTIEFNSFKNSFIAHATAPGMGAHVYNGNSYLAVTDPTER